MSNKRISEEQAAKWKAEDAQRIARSDEPTFRNCYVDEALGVVVETTVTVRSMTDKDHEKANWTDWTDKVVNEWYALHNAHPAWTDEQVSAAYEAGQRA